MAALFVKVLALRKEFEDQQMEVEFEAEEDYTLYEDAPDARARVEAEEPHAPVEPEVAQEPHVPVEPEVAHSASPPCPLVAPLRAASSGLFSATSPPAAPICETPAKDPLECEIPDNMTKAESAELASILAQIQELEVQSLSESP